MFRKQTIGALILLASTTAAPAQHLDKARLLTPSEREQRLWYLRKSGEQRTVGLFLISAGAGLVAVAARHFDPFNSDASGLAGIVGVGAIAAGVPTFINSFHNRRKARLLLRTQSVPLSAHLQTQVYSLSAHLPVSR